MRILWYVLAHDMVEVRLDDLWVPFGLQICKLIVKVELNIIKNKLPFNKPFQEVQPCPTPGTAPAWCQLEVCLRYNSKSVPPSQKKTCFVYFQDIELAVKWLQFPKTRAPHPSQDFSWLICWSCVFQAQEYRVPNCIWKVSPAPPQHLSRSSLIINRPPGEWQFSMLNANCIIVRLCHCPALGRTLLNKHFSHLDQEKLQHFPWHHCYPLGDPLQLQETHLRVSLKAIQPLHPRGVCTRIVLPALAQLHMHTYISW